AVRSLACARLGRPAAAAAAARSAAALVARHGLDGTPAAAVLPRGPRSPEPPAAAVPRGSRRLRRELSDAELAVLRLLPTSLTQREIGRELYLSLNTVKTHAAAVYRTLGVSSREEAVAAARRLNLLPG
ncbi:MAG TPA: LuxR C-terminal-related transcriptional regulator, partial [Gaiellaceae bacterium]|nr:LuxR C-terminal-related transcriptional regulator [Gaiellaceae bacterium]